MEIIIVAIIAFSLGWYMGSWITTHLLALSFKQILEDLGVSRDQLLKLKSHIDSPEPEPQAELTPVEITLEQHQGVIYAYRKDNSQFLGQGTDQTTLVDSISKRMTDVRLIIDQADGSDMLQKRNT